MKKCGKLSDESKQYLWELKKWMWSNASFKPKKD